MIDNETPSLALSVAASLDEATSRGLAGLLGWAGFYPGIVGFGGHGSSHYGGPRW